MGRSAPASVSESENELQDYFTAAELGAKRLMVDIF
jgi:hypothetical protein